MSAIALAEPGVESVVVFPGLSVNGPVNVPNSALMFAMLKPLTSVKILRFPLTLSPES